MRTFNLQVHNSVCDPYGLVDETNLKELVLRTSSYAGLWCVLIFFHFAALKFPALREFVKTGKPVWGTCAGLIFLADRAVG